MASGDHVFLCHASADAAATTAIGTLGDAGIGCRIALRDMPVGAAWIEAVDSAIMGAWAVVLLSSPVDRRPDRLGAGCRHNLTC